MTFNDFLVKNKAYLRPDRLQKCKSWPFEVLLTPNHHRDLFMVYAKASEISKVKRLNISFLVKNKEMKKNVSPFYFAFINLLSCKRL